MQKLTLEPYQTSKMKLFVEIILCFEPLTIFAQSSILDAWLETLRFRGTHRRCSIKKAVLKTLWQYSQENTCVGVSLLKRNCKFIIKKQQHRCFPVNIVKFLRTPFLKSISERLFLENQKLHNEKCKDS